MIKEFIQQEIVLPRVRQHAALVVYDPDRRYRELCLELACDTIRVIDVSEGSLAAREDALDALQQLGRPHAKLHGMLIYIPAAAPLNEEEKQIDPFALYTACGAIFPDPGNDGDTYQSLCLKAKPGDADEIRRIFSENPNPDFAVIDAAGAGVGWPQLQALLKAESARGLLLALLAPSAPQQEALSGQSAWVAEAKDLISRSLGFSLRTQLTDRAAIADELWRVVLFSEFVFDLPEALPETLANIPKAADSARPLVEDLCERLRNDRRTQTLYMERAEAVQDAFTLAEHCRNITDFGRRDTFPFEERWFLAQAINAVQRDNPDAVRDILAQHAQSVWNCEGERQSQWDLVRASARLCQACGDYERQLPDHARSLEGLIGFYLSSLREIDRLHRECEQAAADCVETQAELVPLIEHARACYRRVAAAVHALFIRRIEQQGWPPTEEAAGRGLSNTEVFETFIAPKLKESGRRIAYFQVDALRYELGVALERQLAEAYQVELHAAYAPLPSMTPVGMAGLLPDAGHALAVCQGASGILPLLGEQTVNTVSQRMDVLRRRYGSRFADVTLAELIRSTKAQPGTVDLLVVRSREIDAQMENDPEAALGQIAETLKRLRVAIYRLKQQGFHDMVIATDHGFFLNLHAGAGDVCAKPPGKWVNVHDRLLLGDGSADSGNFTLPAEHLGIRGDFAQVAGPRALAPYRAGVPYFHGGLSLQECLVPVLVIRAGADRAEPQKPIVTLTYRNGATRITTRLPVIDVLLGASDLFSQSADFEILLEAHSHDGNVVGEAKAGGPVNPATHTVTLKPGQHIQAALRMQLEFEGPFTVKALDPVTLAAYCVLELETDYVV